MNIGVVVGLMVVLAAIFAVADRAVRLRRLRRAGDRAAGDSVEELVQAGAERDVAETVVVHLRNWMGDPAFAVRASDSLSRVYGLEDDDLLFEVGEIQRRVAARSGAPSAAELEKLMTVADLARHLSRLTEIGM